MRLVFAGTPQTAVPVLDALLASRHEVAAVVTRPDAPVGRGRKVEASPVARRAAAAGLEVLTPARIRDPDFLDRLRAIGPDCCPVTAYGALLPQAALDIPPRGWGNLHFSVLPAWRGAAPVQHAIARVDHTPRRLDRAGRRAGQEGPGVTGYQGPARRGPRWLRGPGPRARRDPGRPPRRAGRHGFPAGPPRRRPGSGQAPDDRVGLGP